MCVYVFVPYDLLNYRTNRFEIWHVGTFGSNLGFFFLLAEQRRRDLGHAGRPRVRSWGKG